MNAPDKIAAIQTILGVKPDKVWGTLSKAALAEVVSEASRPQPQSELDVGTEFDERTEKNLATLNPKVQALFRAFFRKLIPFMAAHGVVPKIISGNRTYEEQNALYAQGRTKPGKIVTNARGGHSNHNFQLAGDIGLFRNGEYLEESSLYRVAGPIGESVGLEWGGRWEFSDEPHYQYKSGLTLAQLRDRVAHGQPTV